MDFKTRLALMDSRQLVETLAEYNSEKSRGILHTEEWQTLMAELQKDFNESRLDQRERIVFLNTEPQRWFNRRRWLS